jgi:predicted TIM-barrel fold metal-dependent hydrolase
MKEGDTPMKPTPTHLSRRDFIAAAMAASAVSALPGSAASSAPAVTTAGGRIDCQSHLFCPEVVTLMEARKSDPTVYLQSGERIIKMGDWLRKIPPHYMDVKAKLAAMDANGIALTALSINDPGPEWFGEDGPLVARMLNEFVARLVREHPGRFFGLCVLPLQDMPASLVELDRAVNQLGMKGILLYTNLAGKFPDEPEFRPLFKRAVELDIPILLHPAKPITTEYVKGYEMTSSLGNMFDNTIALTRIIMAGILDEFPGLKLVCPHLGGTLPYIIGRLDHQTQVLKRGPKYLTRAPSEYLKSIWLDVVSPLPLAIKFAHEFMGPDRLLFSSDHPWVNPADIIRCVNESGIPASAAEKIYSLNARKLFRL